MFRSIERKAGTWHSLAKEDLADLRRLRRWAQGRARRHRVIRALCHKVRALKMRICFRLGLPSVVPAVPEDDWEGLASLRFALAARRRRRELIKRRLKSLLGPPPAAEMSGIRSTVWHPVDRLARDRARVQRQDRLARLGQGRSGEAKA